MLAIKLISVLVAVIFSLSFVSYGIAAPGPGAGGIGGQGGTSAKNLDGVKALEEEKVEQLKAIDVEIPEELLLEELEDIELD